MNSKTFRNSSLSVRASIIAIVVLSGALYLAGADLRVAAPPVASVNAINQTEMRMHLEFLASPELGGRYTLSPGFNVAAKYLASRLKSYGYRGAGASGSYFQPFDLVSAKTDADKCSLSLTIGGSTTQHVYGDFSNGARNGGSAEGGIVFVGLGFSAPSQKHDDYAGLDVKGKIVLLASGGVPKDIDPSKLEDNERGEGAARAHGAVGILTIPTATQALAMKSATFRENSLRFESIRLAAESSNRLGIVRLGGELAGKLLATIDLTAEKVNDAVKQGTPLVGKPISASAKFTVAMAETKTSTQNVVAILDGTDPKLKDEYVTFSAHYDHLRTSAKGEIFPGADDDGSGTTSVLNIAQAMAMHPPKRSIFIIFHAGEELGLLGSQYNADFSPAVPLEKMVVDLNIDMIGRSKPAGDTDKADEQLTGPDTIYLIGADRISKELNEISEKTNATTQKLKLDYLLNDPKHPDRIYFRSDHWNYAKHGVPIIFYFDGVHVDYHKITDTVDKIDFDKMTKVGRLVYETGWTLANMDHRPKKD